MNGRGPMGTALMLSSPRIGQRVQVWYRWPVRTWMPLHGQTGEIVCVSRAVKCRNHGVVIDGVLYVVPCGNLRNPIGGDASG